MRPAAIKYTKLFINNEWVSPIANPRKTFPVINPSTEDVIVNVSEAGVEDVDAAVRAARQCFANVWRATTTLQKSTLLFRVADLIEKNREELVSLESLNNGKPLADSDFDVAEAARCFRYFAGWTDKIFGKSYTTTDEFTTFTRRESVGVCGLIVPWNYPLLMATWKLAPALAAGNTVVIKPSEVTPLTAIFLGKIFLEAGFPPGVVNIVPGVGSIAGNAISSHPDIDKVSFTGSTSVGRMILSSAAKSNIKKTTLELGGKSPMIVCDDAKINNQLISDLWDGAFANMSQNCCCGSRLFIHESIYYKVVSLLEEKAKSLKIGDAFEEGVNFGPLVNEAQFAKVMGFFDIAKKEGLFPLIGGKRFGTKGYFVEPTIYINVDDNSAIARNEIFGPILSILKPFKTLDEVIDRANDTPYGLAGGVWTTDMSKAERVVRDIVAGTIWVNCYNMTPYNIPFGGMKESGNGRDLGEEVLHEYTDVKAVTYRYDTAILNRL